MKTSLKATAALLLMPLALAACGNDEGSLVVYGPTEDLFGAVYDDFAQA